MSIEQTKDTIDRDFRAMSTGSFADHFTWTTMHTGGIIRGPLAVQDAIIALHSRTSDLRTRQLGSQHGCAVNSNSVQASRRMWSGWPTSQQPTGAMRRCARYSTRRTQLPAAAMPPGSPVESRKRDEV